MVHIRFANGFAETQFPYVLKEFYLNDLPISVEVLCYEYLEFGLASELFFPDNFLHFLFAHFLRRLLQYPYQILKGISY